MSRSPLPHCAKPVSFFSHAGDVGQSSGHTTYFSKKHNPEKAKPKTDWVYKEIKKPVLAQIEAGVASLYRCLEPTLIPKVRAVYDDRGDAIATVSKVFPNYIGLKAYLGDNFGLAGHEKETEEKLEALIDAGFAEVLVLSWFFEEDDTHLENIGVIFEETSGKRTLDKVVRVDFDMSGFTLVGQPEFRGDRDYSSTVLRAALSERFSVAEKDMTDFPNLSVADPWYWPTIYRTLSAHATSHAYTSTQADIFKKLAEHKHFQMRAHAEFLKIALLPDQIISKQLSEHVSDQSCLEKLSTRFITKKNELKALLFSGAVNKKFSTVWELLFDARYVSDSEQYYSDIAITPALVVATETTIIDVVKESLRDFMATLRAFHPGADTEAQSHYFVLCRTILQEDMLQCLRLLEDYLATTDASDENREAIFGLRDKLKQGFQSLSGLSALTVEDIFGFARALFDQLDALPKEKASLKLKEFIEEAGRIAKMFLFYCSFLDEHIFTEFLALPNDSMIEASSDRFISVSGLATGALQEGAIHWLRGSAKKEDLVVIFREQRAEYARGISYYAQATTLLSWMSGKGQVPSFTDELIEIDRQLTVAENPDMLCRVISHLFDIRGDEAVQFTKGFFSKMMVRFLASFAEKPLSEQMDNVRIAQYIHEKQLHHLEEDQIDSAMRFFKENLVHHFDAVESRHSHKRKAVL